MSHAETYAHLLVASHQILAIQEILALDRVILNGMGKAFANMDVTSISNSIDRTLVVEGKFDE